MVCRKQNKVGVWRREVADVALNKCVLGLHLRLWSACWLSRRSCLPSMYKMARACSFGTMESFMLHKSLLAWEQGQNILDRLQLQCESWLFALCETHSTAKKKHSKKERVHWMLQQLKICLLAIPPAHNSFVERVAKMGKKITVHYLCAFIENHVFI